MLIEKHRKQTAFFAELSWILRIVCVFRMNEHEKHFINACKPVHVSVSVDPSVLSS